MMNYKKTVASLLIITVLIFATGYDCTGQVTSFKKTQNTMQPYQRANEYLPAER